MELTRKMIAWTEFLLFSSLYPARTAERRRLLRINEYLCKRYNRDDSPEEREVYDLISPPVEYGGEG